MSNSKTITAPALAAAPQSNIRVTLKFNPKSDHVHLNDEAPFSFKVTLPESSTLVSQPSMDLASGSATFEFTFGGVAGDVKVVSRLFYCSDAGQCVSEGVDFTFPVHEGGNSTEHVISYDYDVETKKKLSIF